MILRILRVLGFSPTANAPANYTAVNEGRVEYTVDGVAVQAPLVHLIDENGASVEPLNADQLAGAGLALNETVAKTNTSLGSDGASPPAITGTGVRGWLRGIYERLGDTLQTRALSASTDTVNVGNFPATQSVSGTVTANTGLSQPLTDAQLRAEAVPVSGIFFPDTQPVSAAALPLPQGAARLSEQTTANTILTSISTKIDGVATTDYQVDTISWLGELYTELGLIKDRLNENANGNLSTAIAEALPAGTNRIGEVITVPKTNEASTYFVSTSVFPMGAGLSAGSNLFCLRNTVSTKSIKIKRVRLSLTFSGTAAAGRNFFSLRRGSVTGVTGGTASLASKAASPSPASATQCAFSATGLTLTGATVEDPIEIYPHVTQMSGVSFDREFLDAPIVLAQNEVILIQAANGLVSGSNLFAAVEWTEE